ncbi:MAG: hypothetical protein JXB88_12345, partial [Spirochaetales bacterium]|nr:hypothetical protein [Spirochaetales bacterium]
MSEIFLDWRNRTGRFRDRSHISLFEELDNRAFDEIFRTLTSILSRLMPRPVRACSTAGLNSFSSSLIVDYCRNIWRCSHVFPFIIQLNYCLFFFLKHTFQLIDSFASILFTV